MMHENYGVEILRAIVMVVNLEKKEITIKGDRCNLAKDPPTVKSVFSFRLMGLEPNRFFEGFC